MKRIKISLSASHFRIQDPLFVILTKKLFRSPLKNLLFLISLNALSIFGGGYILSYVVYPNANIIRVFDPQHLYFALIAAVFIFPLSLYFYLWQPFETSIEKLLLKYMEIGILFPKEKEKEKKPINGFKEKINYSFIPFLALVTATIFILVQDIFVIPNEVITLGKAYFWYYNKVYFFLLYEFFLLIAYYTIASVVFRIFLSLYELNRVFAKFRVKVQPLHPDGAGGLGALGSLAITLSSLFVGIGLLASLSTIVRVIIGSGWFYLDTIFMYTIYIAFVPISLITPIWTAHNAMMKTRNAILLEIANNFEGALLNDKNLDEIKEDEVKKTNLKLIELKNRHAMVIETYPIWPISPKIFQRFSFTAVMPLITGLGSFLIDLIKT